MSTISTEQAKDLRNAFECWQQDYDPVEDKEQYEMFGLGVVAMDELLALRKEREAAVPVAYRYRFRPTSEAAGKWILVDSLEEANPLPKYEIQPLYNAPAAPVVGNDSLPYDPQIAEYEQMMEAELKAAARTAYKVKSELSQMAEKLVRDTTELAATLSAETDTASQRFESLAGKTVGGSEGFECTPVADLYELLTKCGECYDYTTSAKVAADWIKEGYSAREYVKLDRLQEAMTQGSSGEADGWIPCSERMPDLKQEVLCVNRWGDFEVAVYDVGYITGEPFFATIDGEFHPTHWQPLPEPQCK
ncbi:DUF551 domain-containing protein [Cronobacter sakazakii]|nr:DUF551 domain-containing protein [Cronobacter sakazakii]ELQ6154290.1 DUF551 domain-containing protein [Cronobacter sakazakii]ELQ6163251.1 DUF551 domain-containing protein [Cronobacter sakazakii]